MWHDDRLPTSNSSGLYRAASQRQDGSLDAGTSGFPVDTITWSRRYPLYVFVPSPSFPVHSSCTWYVCCFPGSSSSTLVRASSPRKQLALSRRRQRREPMEERGRDT